jgi:hypothetical protein
MITIKKISLFIFLLFTVAVTAQENDTNLKNRFKHKNIADLTLGGTGIGLSINYGRILIAKSNYFVDMSVGLGVMPNGITLPHSIRVNLGVGNNFLELGVGGTYITGKTDESGFTESFYSYQLSPIIGWRRHFENNLVFRVYANPLIHLAGDNFIEDYSIVPYLGLSLGYRF